MKKVTLAMLLPNVVTFFYGGVVVKEAMITMPSPFSMMVLLQKNLKRSSKKKTKTH
jgi:hypothetical protein